MNKISVAISDESFDAYDGGGDWNGFARPLFTKEVGLALCDSDDFRGLLKYENDRFVFDDGITHEEYEGIDIDGLHLYAIGVDSMAWCV